MTLEMSLNCCSEPHVLHEMEIAGPPLRHMHSLVLGTQKALGKRELLPPVCKPPQYLLLTPFSVRMPACRKERPSLETVYLQPQQPCQEPQVQEPEAWAGRVQRDAASPRGALF